MRQHYACGSLDHRIARRSFLGVLGGALGLGPILPRKLCAGLSQQNKAGGRRLSVRRCESVGVLGSEADDRHRRSVSGDSDERARYPYLRTVAQDGSAHGQAVIGSQLEHQEQRPRQGEVPDAVRAESDAWRRVPPSGCGLRASAGAKRKPAAGAHPDSRRRAGRGRRVSRSPVCQCGGGRENRRPTRLGMSRWPLRSTSSGTTSAAARTIDFSISGARRRRTCIRQSYEQALQLMEQRDVFDVSKEAAADHERYGKHDFRPALSDGAAAPGERRAVRPGFPHELRHGITRTSTSISNNWRSSTRRSRACWGTCQTAGCFPRPWSS